jgi:hypothetical protein
LRTIIRINYNTIKEKWSLSDLIAMCVQEEERIKAERRDVMNQVGSSSKKSQGGNRGRKRNNNAYAPCKKPQQSFHPPQNTHNRLLIALVVPQALHLLVMRRKTVATSATMKVITGMTALGG